ncbi:MAG: cytochrome c3 family protein, partial [Candidatus Hermodarchaeia archaeon]
ITISTCSDCHTMHNSQNNTTMRGASAGVQPGPSPECNDCHADIRKILLQMDCLGCHAQNPGGVANIVNSNWPQIAHNNSIDLAGGNYRDLFSSLGNPDSHGHNVHGFGNAEIAADSDLANNPPGYEANYDPSSGGYDTATVAGQIMCAGQNGCHGNRDQVSSYAAMNKTHHADDSMLKFGSIAEGQQGSTSGTSYRFLYKVLGGEDSDWQASVSATDHNEYKGALFGGRGQTQNWSDVTTISDLCAECHGVYHAGGLVGDIGIGSSSPWLRHPTDAQIPNTGEYASYTAYSTEAPVARVTIPNSPSNAVNPGTDDAIVMCLSCHRAHASPYPDALRWDYSTMIAGGGGSGGCFTCHTQKD